MRRAGWILLFGSAVALVAACVGDDPISPTTGEISPEAGPPATPPPTIPPDATTPPAPILHVVPSGKAGQSTVAAGTIDLTLTGDTVIDTTAGSIKTGGVAQTGFNYGTVDQDNGAPSIAVFTVKSLTIPAGITLHVTGTRALALLAEGDINVHGTLEVRADCANATAGAGGYGGGAPATPGDSLAGAGAKGAVAVSFGGTIALCSGGGGGGNGTKGGSGASTVDTVDGGTTTPRTTAAAAGGVARAKDLLVLPILAGGSGGGNGGNEPAGTTTARLGGAGGGALQLVASGTIVVSGTIDAGGCGGQGGATSTTSNKCIGAGGGGAGGAIFLESASITIAATGRILANGGGGGGGQIDTKVDAGANGGDENDTAAAAADGGRTFDEGFSFCPNGGNGSPGNTDLTTPCTRKFASTVAGPGGGGGAGAIAMKTKDGNIVTTTGAIVSPAPSLGVAVLR